jgi:hypothetical protein
MIKQGSPFKKTVLFLAIMIIAAGACHKVLGKIPTGTWKYRLIVNGARIGTAVVTNAVSGNRYVSTMDMNMDAGYIKNSTRQVITETLDFKPVKLEVYNRTIQNGQETELKTVAAFTGTRVDLDTGDAKSTFTIEKPFILEGNYFMNELIKCKFKKDTILSSRVYEPSVDPEEPVLVMVKVIGREEVQVNGKTMDLIHLGYSIENLKNIDTYIDDNGITQKTVITMLNNRLELVLE